MKQIWKKINPGNWIEITSPLTLGFAGLSLAALILGWLTGGDSTRALFSVYRASAASPLFYLRLLLHVLGHVDFAHYTSNMALFLVLGPLVEQRYGARRMAMMIALTALITGLSHLLISPDAAVLGASGIVFMLILLSAAAGRKSGKSPLTLVLVALMYLGQEIAGGILQKDNISQWAHIIGGLCGMAFGLVCRSKPS